MNKRFFLFFFNVSVFFFSGTVQAGLPADAIWEARLPDFSEQSYARAVEAAFVAYEKASGKPLVPQEKGRVGIKVYTNSGSGLATPQALTLAVIKGLVKRGYTAEKLFIFDLSAGYLRASGYLPPLSKGGRHFAGVPVYWLNDGAFYDKLWFYDNPLPSRNPAIYDSKESADMKTPEAKSTDVEGRKSFLPIPLLLTADFWINLPMVVDLPSIGVSGALANISLWNASNTKRFFSSPANAPVAVTEIAAIPEIKQNWVFTLLTLERYQYIGGSVFNSLYTETEPLLWMSANPVVLDYLMLQRMNRQRLRCSLPEISPRPLIFDYAEAIGLGKWNPTDNRIFPLELK